jgi:hypothetical protein
VKRLDIKIKGTYINRATELIGEYNNDSQDFSSARWYRNI